MTNVFRKEYKELTESQIKLSNDIKDTAQKLYDLYGSAESSGTAGREVALAKTKLEESVMWAIKGVTA